jgi:GTP 3',8-cyclase
MSPLTPLPEGAVRAIAMPGDRRGAPRDVNHVPAPTSGLLADRLGRPLRDLRISVTDRCNFRCTYCMPADAVASRPAFRARSEILTFDEIVRLARIFAGLGVQKIRLTGGEPLVRRDLPDLVRQLARLDGIRDLALTTNGSALAAMAPRLRDAGLKRVTVSLDSLDPDVYGRMNGIGFPVARVLEAISTSIAVGLTPVKVNMVVERGVNEGSVLPMARYARDRGIVLRLIEFMDAGLSNDWDPKRVVPMAELVALIDAELSIEPIPSATGAEVAELYRYRDGGGEIGFISSVTRPFCGTCSRARLTADGQLVACLFAAGGLDLRGLLRAGASDEEIEGLIRGAWEERADRYSEERTAASGGRRRLEMYAVGG